MSLTSAISFNAKYAGETRNYSFQFNQRTEIINGDTISSINSITATPTTTPPLSLGTQTISGTQVLCVISSGLSGTTYYVSCLITTSSGAVLECFGSLLVQ